MRPLIIVVDSSAHVIEPSRVYLEQAGYSVLTLSADAAIQEAMQTRPSLFLIAAMFQHWDGIELCQRIRETAELGQIPVVFVTDEDVEEYRVLALDSGGDDCIVKPFSPRELVARIQAVLRRVGPGQRVNREEAPDMVIDSSAMKVSVRGNEVSTTSLEFRLIEYLARHRGQVFTRDLLLDAVWGDMQFVTPRSVDACIRRIREKIEPDRTTPTFLKTVRGVGYRLDAVTSWQTTSNEGCDCIACNTPAGVSPALYMNHPRRKRAMHTD
jgi:DNA-binding response OmpR family regulator